MNQQFPFQLLHLAGFEPGTVVSAIEIATRMNFKVSKLLYIIIVTEKETLLSRDERYEICTNR